MFDYLIVGAGLFGAVCAHELTKAGKRVLVIDRRAHIGGNAYTERIEGIDVHRYGAHIFHTKRADIWNYVRQFSELIPYINAPIANYKGELYNLPFNMNTFYRLWGVTTPSEAKARLEREREGQGKTPANVEEQALCSVGRTAYEKLIKGYTEKQWGKPCDELPPFILRRVPLRFTFDNNYFNDPFQGIPKEGYTAICERMLKCATVQRNVDFFGDRKGFLAAAKRVIYTGEIDKFYEYRYGALEYRSLRFETKVLNEENYQGNAVVNYTDRETPFTRVIEHKHFCGVQSEKTVVTYEYPEAFRVGGEPYYPVNDEKNEKIYQKYRTAAEREEKVLFGGRLGTYRYLDMDGVIAAALKLCEGELCRKA